MALTTIIAFAAGLAAKVRPPKDPLAPEVMRLLAENERAAGRIAQLERLVETLDRELLTERNLKAHWREEARHLATRLHWEAQDQHAQQQHGAMLAQQANAQMAQQAAMQDGRYLQALGFQQLGQVAQNVLGAQNLQMSADWVCTCIPDRASALRHR